MIEQLVKLAADLGGRLIFVGEIVFAFILKRCVMQLGEGVVLQSKFQRDLFAAVFRIAAAVYAVRIRFGFGQFRRIDDFIRVAVQSVPQGGNQLAGFHRRRRHRVEIFHNVIRRVEVVDGRNVFADEIIGKLAVLAEDGFLRVACVFAHVVAVLVFHAAIHQRIESAVLEFKLDGNLLDAAVVIKPAVNAVGIFLSGCGKGEGGENRRGGARPV